jgi:alkylated DNA repair protein (DNA oxidative demethylase)
VAPFPDGLAALSGRAVADASAVDRSLSVGHQATGPAAAATGADVGYRPDVALINWYGPGAKMGMHADRDERCAAPVVSLSLGDTCVFRFGNVDDRRRPWTDVVLESGDLFVFGGPARRAFHGVPKVHPGTAAPGIGIEQGRINLTVRQSGLTEPVTPRRPGPPAP